VRRAADSRPLLRQTPGAATVGWDPSLVAPNWRLAPQANGYSLWQQARAQGLTFSSFAPALVRLIALRQEQARQLAPVETTADWPAAAAVGNPGPAV